VRELKRATDAQDAAIALVEATPGARAESFWLRNTLVVYGGAPLARAIAKLPGVKTVRAEKTYPLVKPVETQAAILAAEPEWGVEKIGADDVWAEGILGSGIVVANVDTGVQYDHPALVNQYRGNLGGGVFDHNYSWWDPTDVCGDEPCDNAGHGTHTMGTMVGGDGPGPFTPDIGVAPGARWIAAKGCEDLFCSDVALLSAGQFILAPTDVDGNNPDPTKRPDIVNNSWGGGPGDEFYRDVVEAWRAAGIIPVFSAGNSGPGCDSGGSPGDFNESFSAGATDINDEIADFSSRGPSVYGKVNPDVSAPGVAVSSSVPGDGYAEFDGTSMAAPHVAGTLALIMSAELALVGDFEAATTALRDTALDILDDQCGGAEDGDPNNVYGDGRIDAAAAVALVATGGTLAGTVTDLDTGDPIGGATVTASAGGRDFSATTASDGTYDMFLAAGEYAVTGIAFGYALSAVEVVTIVTDETTTQDLELDALPRFDVTGVVTAASDGAPIEGASVKAIGAPVDPAITDAGGAYTLNLPIGSYTLRATAGGCTEEGFAEVELIDADVVADFSIARKLDDFGHGCSPIAFDWVDASTTTPLFGDEFVGRLSLPFDFPFYGETYDEVWLSDNGYLNFLGPDQFNSFPVEIPSESDPNAAIYALWQDLHVDSEGAIKFEIVGTSPDQAFVIEYENVMAGSSARTFEIKLWENGDIDLLYAETDSGEDAGIGIENADGTDALSFGFFSDVLTDDAAYRFTEVPSGLVTGTVTDLNDGEPIEGAVVEALTSGRSTETAADGTYQMRLLPGSYDLEIRADGYATHTEPIIVADDDVLTVDAELAAPIATVTPPAIDESVALGESTEATVTVSNTGTAPLDWEVRERPTAEEPPDLPEITGSVTRIPTWEAPSVPRNLPTARTTTIPSEQLSEIITDPEGDGGTVDVTAVRAGADSDEITMELNFASDADAESAVGFVFLDTDQDPETGEPPEFFFGDPAQDVGLEYFVDMFLAHEFGVVFIVDAITFEIVAETEARVVGNTLGFDVPLEAIGGDDGFVNTALVVGDIGPTDWAPDEGHGTIEPFSDAPWVAESPESGTVAAGESTEVTVTLGGEDVDPGMYEGLLVFITSDPKAATHNVELRLEVGLPETFGGASGTVWDAHFGEPLSASILIEAEDGATPYPIEVTAGNDGGWEAFGPAGTWPMTTSLDGYVTDIGAVEITAGAMTPNQDVFLHAEQPHAFVDGGPLKVVMRPDRTAFREIGLLNLDGHAPLTFEIGEVNHDIGAAVGAASAPRTLPAGWDTNARTTEGLTSSRVDAGAIQFPGDVLAAWPTEGVDLPWGVGFTGNVWLTDPIAEGDACGFVDGCTIHEFDTDGVPGTVLDAPWASGEEWPADMAYDADRGWLWTIHVGGDNGLYAIDPADGSVEQVLTGDPWSDISQRGVAYDGDEDVFYIGGWNEGVIYKVAGPSWPTPGETLSSCLPADPSISGLAWNSSFDLLWMATNSEFDDIFLVDPTTCDLLSVIFHPEGGGGNGAGIEVDAGGNLWTVSQNSATAYLLGSGLPVFSNVPWLKVTPTEGEVGVNGSQALTVRVRSHGLAPGVYGGDIVVLTNDPDAAAVSVPVTLVVPAYQLGVNAGGKAYDTPGGIRFRTDRAYSVGNYGYSGTSEKRTTSREIRGTTDDPLYQAMRVGMGRYRFDVPVDGIYKVQLRFAEIEHNLDGPRVFTVFVEGRPVLVNLDVAGRVGERRALNLTFETRVTDGILNVRFSGQQGDAPMISAILVTHRPDLE
jgi:subtilisin family serine protease